MARAQLYPLVRLSGTIGTSATDVGSLFDLVTGNIFAGLTQAASHSITTLAAELASIAR